LNGKNGGLEFVNKLLACIDKLLIRTFGWRWRNVLFCSPWMDTVA